MSDVLFKFTVIHAKIVNKSSDIILIRYYLIKIKYHNHTENNYSRIILNPRIIIYFEFSEKILDIKK